MEVYDIPSWRQYIAAKKGAVMLGRCLKLLSHTPHCFEGMRIMFMNRAWAIQVFVMNNHNPFMHCATSQYVFKLRDVMMLVHAVPIVALSNSTVCHTVTMLRPFKWHVSPRLNKRNGTNCEFEKYVTMSSFFVLNSLDKSHLNPVCTQYVCDKSENARVCAKWQWNALDWCYSPGVQSSNTSRVRFTVISYTPVRSCYRNI